MMTTLLAKLEESNRLARMPVLQLVAKIGMHASCIEALTRHVQDLGEALEREQDKARRLEHLTEAQAEIIRALKEPTRRLHLVETPNGLTHKPQAG